MDKEKQHCPCHSGKLYEECCQPYHLGKLPENALILMRSRYAAYALHLPEYIMATTHPRNPDCFLQTKQWKEEISLFSRLTNFSDLTIHDFIDGSKEAYVTFTANLKQNGMDISFTEKSRFLKENGRWLYESGQRLPS